MPGADGRSAPAVQRNAYHANGGAVLDVARPSRDRWQSSELDPICGAFAPASHFRRGLRRNWIQSS
jgi:hypothetical protein